MNREWAFVSSVKCDRSFEWVVPPRADDAAHAVTVVVVVCGSYVQRRRVSVGRLTVVVILNRCDSMVTR